jgi:hypothetical protein
MSSNISVAGFPGTFFAALIAVPNAYPAASNAVALNGV